MKFMLAALAAALAGAPVPPAPSPAPAPTFAEAIAICRLAEAGSAEAKARYAAIAEAARPAVMLVCLGYHQALLDREAALQGAGTGI